MKKTAERKSTKKVDFSGKLDYSSFSLPQLRYKTNGTLSCHKKRNSCMK